MSVQTKEILKSYFETGDKPTQAQFADLIDSCFNLPESAKRTVTVTNIADADTTATLTISGSKAQLQHTVTYLYTYLTNNNNIVFIGGVFTFVHDTPKSTIAAYLLYSSSTVLNKQYTALVTITAYNIAYIVFINTNIYTEFNNITFTYVGCAYATY